MRHVAPAAIGVVLAILVAAPPARADWPSLGGDPGMTKYSAGNIPADEPLEVLYSKRLCGKWGSYTGNYDYACNVAIRGGQALVLSNDAPYLDYYQERLQATLLDWQTGQTVRKYPMPGMAEWGNASLHYGEHAREIDSHHFTHQMIWHEDGRVYVRRGGDHRVTAAMNPATGSWLKLPYYSAAPGYSNWGGDCNGFVQAYGDRLIYRPGDTRTTGPYIAVDISDAAWTGRTVGTWQANVGPYAPKNSAQSDSTNAMRYGDISKAAQGLCVLAAYVRTDDPYPDRDKVWLEAVNLTTGTTAWQSSWSSDTGGNRGFYTSVSDYWRFLATEDGHYAFFTRQAGSTRVRVLDLQTGQQKWSHPMGDSQERPLMAYHDGALYVIGRSEQLKLDADTGEVLWSADHSFPSDQGYTLSNYEYGSRKTTDPLYRPMVLTDETLWFVDGRTGGSTHTLVGLSTADGGIVQEIDLAEMYDDAPAESLLVVNDMAASDGLLGVLVGVKDANDPNPTDNPGADNGMVYQDLIIFRPVPEPTTVVLLAVGLAGLLRRRRRR